jgi:hypothetical protein
MFATLPGLPRAVDLVANLDYYQQAIGTTDVDFILVRTYRHDSAETLPMSCARAPGGDPLNIDTTESAIDKDQSNLTALNVPWHAQARHGLHAAAGRSRDRDLGLRFAARAPAVSSSR